MLTIFSCPKPFTNPHINIIQRNAIKSWTLLQPKPEIILLGDEDGVEKICREFELQHISNVERNEYGTPFLNSIFKEAQQKASNNLVCYINCDIILMSDFYGAIKKVIERFKNNKFLIIGRRWDVDISTNINFDNNLENWLKKYVKEKGKLHTHAGIDCFVFAKGQYKNIPPLIFARTTWDNWLVYKASKEKVPIIDISDATIVIHQNHDYSHQKWTHPLKNPETEYNIKLVGRYSRAFTSLDAHYKLKNDKLIRNISLFRFYFKAKRFIRHRLLG